MRQWVRIVLISAVAVWGCARAKHQPVPGGGPGPAVTGSQPNQKAILTPDTGLYGKVVGVNPNGRFAILNFPVGHLPALEQRLNVYRLGLKTGEIRVSGPQYDDDIVGDVVAGDVQPGDEVRDR